MVPKISSVKTGDIFNGEVIVLLMWMICKGSIIALGEKRARFWTETILLYLNHLNVEMYIFDTRKVYNILVVINESNSVPETVH